MASALTRRAISRGFPVAQDTRLRVLRRTAILYKQQMSSRYVSVVSSQTKFQGRRTTLDVKLPDLEEAEESSQIDPANVPFVPDLFHSEAKSAEIEASKPKASLTDTPTPKVVTASAENTLPGVSSNIFQKADDLKAFTGVEAEKAKSKVEDKLQGVTDVLRGWTLPGLGSAESSVPETESSPDRKQLNRDDVQGLYVLLGIVGGGWLLGGLFSKKGTQPAKHAHGHGHTH